MVTSRCEQLMYSDYESKCSLEMVVKGKMKQSGSKEGLFVAFGEQGQSLGLGKEEGEDVGGMYL